MVHDGSVRANFKGLGGGACQAQQGPSKTREGPFESKVDETRLVIVFGEETHSTIGLFHW